MMVARARARLLPTILLGTVLLLGGCAGEEPSDLDSATATELQEAVVLVARSAADGEHEQALAELDALQRELDLATAGGRVGGTRPEQIQTALDAVRTELEALVAADAETTVDPAVQDTAPAVVEPESPAPAPAGTTAAPEAPAVTTAPAPAPAPGGPAPGGPAPGSNGNGPGSNSGKGDGSDKSSGNNGKGKG